MIRNIPQFLIAAPTSGTGKTTVSRLLMTLLTQKNYVYSPISAGRIISTRSIMKKLAEFRLTIWTFLWLPSIMYVRYIIIMQ